VDEFRCHGCGRALKVPPQVKPVGVGAAAPAPPDLAAPPPGLDRGATAPFVQAASTSPDVDLARADEAPRDDAVTRVLARAQADGRPSDGDGPDPNTPAGDAVLPRSSRRRAVGTAAQAVVLPRVLRLVIWAVMLPVGLGGTFYVALRTDWLSRDDLLGTIGEADWSRFVPIAWLMPIAAIVVALLVHCTVVALEQLIGRRRLRRAGTGGASTASSRLG
jgi:hypothetical protein